jgi:hypothetical protein
VGEMPPRTPANRRERTSPLRRAWRIHQPLQQPRSTAASGGGRRRSDPGAP